MHPIKDIKQENDDGEAHGLWKIYNEDGTLHWYGNYINDKEVGYHKFIYFDGQIDHEFFII